MHFPMEIFYCKTDQHMDGAWIVAHTVTKIYPVFPLGESDLQLFHKSHTHKEWWHRLHQNEGATAWA